MRTILEGLSAVVALVGGALGRLALVAAALLLVTIVARPGCACTTKAGAAYTAMRADLRNLAMHHDAHREARGTFSTQWRPSEFRLSTGTVLVSHIATPDVVHAEIAYPSLTPARCTVVIRPDTDPVIGCTPELRRPRSLLAVLRHRPPTRPRAD